VSFEWHFFNCYIGFGKEVNMLNQVVIVGRLVKSPEVVKTDSGKKVSNITLAVSRSYKDENGEYQTDFINCVLWEGIAENTAEYVKKGDLLGIKGHLQSRIYKKDENTTVYVIEVIAEKVTFLSSKPKEAE
jgi:single-strand DNA-binding protein